MEYVVKAGGPPINMQLLADGAVPTDALTITPTLVLLNASGGAVSVTGSVTIVDGALWRIRYSPSATDLVAASGPYKAKFQVTTSSGVVDFPSPLPDTWIVTP